MPRSPFLCLVLSLFDPSPEPGLSGDSPSGRDRAATRSLPCGDPPHSAPYSGSPRSLLSPSKHHRAHAPSTLPPLPTPAGMDASWRQVAGGRGRARGRATAAPSSGNGVHLRCAGGGREKGSVGAAGPGPSPGGAATASAAGSSARRSPWGSEAPQTSVASGENGTCRGAHLDAC